MLQEPTIAYNQISLDFANANYAKEKKLEPLRHIY